MLRRLGGAEFVAGVSQEDREKQCSHLTRREKRFRTRGAYYAVIAAFISGIGLGQGEAPCSGQSGLAGALVVSVAAILLILALNWAFRIQNEFRVQDGSAED
jgi:hypothetical protein